MEKHKHDQLLKTPISSRFVDNFLTDKFFSPDSQHIRTDSSSATTDTQSRSSLSSPGTRWQSPGPAGKTCSTTDTKRSASSPKPSVEPEHPLLSLSVHTQRVNPGRLSYDARSAIVSPSSDKRALHKRAPSNWPECRHPQPPEWCHGFGL